MSSAQEYLLVSQGQVSVEHYICQKTEWVRTEYQGLSDVVPLRSIDCELCLQDIYARTELVLNVS